MSEVPLDGAMDASAQQLGKALDRARMGEDRDLAARVREAGERFVRQLFGCLRMVRLHDLENAAFERPLTEVCQSLGELNELLGAVHLVVVEGQAYVNDVRVRLDERQDTGPALGRELARHDLGGLSFHEVPDLAGMRVFIAAFASEPDPDRPRLALRDKLRAGGMDRLDLVGAFRFRVTGEENTVRGAKDEERSRDRAATLVDASVDSLGQDRMPNPLPLRRAVTELLEGSGGTEALTDEPAHSTPYSRHVLRVSVLALLIGRELGLSDEALQDLGVSAMFHDVGYAAREGAVSAAPGRAAEPGYAPPFERHAAAGARLLLRQRGFHESKILRALATLHHTWRFDDPRGRPSLFGRILHVCEGYEALVQLSPERVSPPRALASLQAEAGGRYDPICVQALINALGLYPPGTQLRLSDGRVVEAFAVPKRPEDWAAPVCRVLRGADGRRESSGQVVDLSIDPAEIVAVLEPRARGGAGAG